MMHIIDFPYFQKIYKSPYFLKIYKFPLSYIFSFNLRFLAGRLCVWVNSGRYLQYTDYRVGMYQLRPSANVRPHSVVSFRCYLSPNNKQTNQSINLELSAMHNALFIQYNINQIYNAR